MPKQIKSLKEKIYLSMKNIGTLDKTKDSIESFMYFAYDDVINAVNEMAVKYKFNIATSVIDCSTVAVADKVMAQVAIELEIECVESDEIKKYRGVGVHTDTPFSAVDTAHSSAFKALLVKIFLIKATPIEKIPFKPDLVLPQDKDKEPVSLTYSKTSIRPEIHELHTFIESTSTQKQLDSVIEEWTDIIEQCKILLPEWYSSNGEPEGLLQVIERKANEFKITNKEEDY